MFFFFYLFFISSFFIMFTIFFLECLVLVVVSHPNHIVQGCCGECGFPTIKRLAMHNHTCTIVFHLREHFWHRFSSGMLKLTPGMVHLRLRIANRPRKLCRQSTTLHRVPLWTEDMPPTKTRFVMFTILCALCWGVAAKPRFRMLLPHPSLTCAC